MAFVKENSSIIISNNISVIVDNTYTLTGDAVGEILPINIYIQPMILLLTILTNTLNIFVLCGRALYNSACTHYFLAHAIFCTTYNCLLCPMLFGRGFSFNWVQGNIECKAHVYILFLLPFQANLMIILASFDRFCSSSCERRLNSLSTVRKARKNILCSFILGILYTAPMLFIYYWDELTKICSAKHNITIHFYVLIQVVLYYILSPILILLLGILTIRNIRQNRKKTPTQRQKRRDSRTNGQLARMLLFQIVIHLILVLPFGSIYTIHSFFPSTQTPPLIATRFIFVIVQQCDCFASFFLYILTGSVYRQELRRIFNLTERIHRRNLILRSPQVFFYGELPITYSSVHT